MRQDGTPGTRWNRRAVRGLAFFLLVPFLILLVAGCTASIQMLASPGLLLQQAPEQGTINTPAFAPTGAWPTPGGNILPVTPSPTAAGAGRPAVVSSPTPAQPAPATPPIGAGPAAAAAAPSPASAAPVSGQELAFALPQPAFEIAPQVGTPGMQIAVLGQGWAPQDIVALRLQDPANEQVQQTFTVANADGNGDFKTNFTVPATAPWADRPAILIWAVSQKTGIQAALPQPFVVLSGPLQPAALATATTGPTPEPTVAVPTAAPAATATATVPTPESPLATPTSTLTDQALPTATAEITGTATPEPTANPTFQSPLPTPTAGPTLLPTEEPTLAPTATVLPAFQSPLPTPTSVPTAEPTMVAPGVLPRAGAAILPTTYITAARAGLRAGPGAGYPLLRTLPHGAAAGIAGQSPAGDWLLVTTSHGMTGWLPRSQTDFAGAAAVVQP